MRQTFPRIGGALFAASILFAPAPVLSHNCKCRHAGQSYELGQIVCIRGQLARCDMVLNNSSWKMLANTCPEATAPEAEPFSTPRKTALATPLR